MTDEDKVALGTALSVKILACLPKQCDAHVIAIALGVVLGATATTLKEVDVQKLFIFNTLMMANDMLATMKITQANGVHPDDDRGREIA